MMRDVAVILTAFNRPTLVVDAIESVLEQDCDRWRLYIMDDGSDDETREAIAGAVAGRHGDDRITWWMGDRRPMSERKSSISYSRTINHALGALLKDEKYVAYLCDDDFLYPEAVRVRAEYLDANPDVHVCYGRSRSIHYGAGGFNTWDNTIKPVAGRACPRPGGHRELFNDGASAKAWFDAGELDPQTGLPYVEEAVWYEGPVTYGAPYRMDHSQVMHRRECLVSCRTWPDGASLGGKEFWGENRNVWSVGDAAFFTLLGEIHPFFGVNCWTLTKRFHDQSDGCSGSERRE